MTRVRRSSATPRCGRLLDDNSNLTGRVLGRKRHTGTSSSGVKSGSGTGRGVSTQRGVVAAERPAETFSAMTSETVSSTYSTRGRKSRQQKSPSDEAGLRSGAGQMVGSLPVLSEEDETWEDAEEGDVSLEVPEQNNRSHSSAAAAVAGKVTSLVPSSANSRVLADIIARVLVEVLASEEVRNLIPGQSSAVLENISAAEIISANVTSGVSSARGTVARSKSRDSSLEKLPTFDAVSQNLESFLNVFDSVREYQGWSDSKAAVQLRLLLRGRAADVLIDQESRKWSFERLSEELREKFSAKALAEQFQFEIRTRRRQKGEALTDLYNDFARLGASCLSDRSAHSHLQPGHGRRVLVKSWA